MSGFEIAALTKPIMDGLNKTMEQNMMSQLQAGAQEGKIPQIAELFKTGGDVQESLAKKLTDAGEDKPKFQVDETKRRLDDGYNEELRQVVPEGGVPNIDVSEWKHCRPEETATKRGEFARSKQELIRDWEQENGRAWPRYQENVYDEKTGTQIRKSGDYYDAHHVQPLELGGVNRADNLVPAHANDHYDHRGIHRSDGPLAQLTNQIKGA